jgi:hypothetical protein
MKQNSLQLTDPATAVEAAKRTDLMASTTKSRRKEASASPVGTLNTETSLAKTPPLKKPTRAELIDKIKRHMCQLTGIKSKELANRIFYQVGLIQVLEPPTDRLGDRLGIALQTLGELQPQNATQALLATQMIGVHHAAITFLHRATLQGQTFDGADANVLRATRLMRLFNEQLEAMARLKGKTGQQKVIVEHVHVHEG